MVSCADEILIYNFWSGLWPDSSTYDAYVLNSATREMLCFTKSLFNGILGERGYYLHIPFRYKVFIYLEKESHYE